MQNDKMLRDFLNDSLTGYHAVENAKTLLTENGFTALSETEDWQLCENGKYFVERNGSLIAFTVGNLDEFSYKIAATHVDSPALKLKEKPLRRVDSYATLNVETYGGLLRYSFLDRPLRIAGRAVRNIDGRLVSETVQSPFLVTIPSLAIHMNRGVNDGATFNPQVDLQPLLGLGEDCNEWLERTVGDNAISQELYLVNADAPYTFGVNDEFLASPRIDNLTGVYASLQALLAHADSQGVCVAAMLADEEIGSRTMQGANGSFLETTLKRVAYAFRFDDAEFFKILASSFLLSVDNAHALHPNHPEKSDPTNKTLLGGGVALKSHANKAYTTDAVSAAIVKTVFDRAGVKHQSFFNRSDMPSGSTLGIPAASQLGILAADIGIAQLAMHSACECFALADYEELTNGITAFYSSDIYADENGFIVK